MNKNQEDPIKKFIIERQAPNYFIQFLILEKNHSWAKLRLH